jgi:hypothetical protein
MGSLRHPDWYIFVLHTQYNNNLRCELMTTITPTTLSLRIDPMIKEGLRLLAEKEHRSFTNMMEVMIRDYCK